MPSPSELEREALKERFSHLSELQKFILARIILVSFSKPEKRKAKSGCFYRDILADLLSQKDTIKRLAPSANYYRITPKELVEYSIQILQKQDFIYKENENGEVLLILNDIKNYTDLKQLAWQTIVPRLSPLEQQLLCIVQAAEHFSGVVVRMVIESLNENHTNEDLLIVVKHLQTMGLLMITREDSTVLSEDDMLHISLPWFKVVRNHFRGKLITSLS